MGRVSRCRIGPVSFCSRFGADGGVQRRITANGFRSINHELNRAGILSDEQRGVPSLYDILRREFRLCSQQGSACMVSATRKQLSVTAAGRPYEPASFGVRIFGRSESLACAIPFIFVRCRSLRRLGFRTSASRCESFPAVIT